MGFECRVLWDCVTLLTIFMPIELLFQIEKLYERRFSDIGVTNDAKDLKRITKRNHLVQNYSNAISRNAANNCESWIMQPMLNVSFTVHLDVG